MRDRLAHLIGAPWWERSIIALICLNAITLGLETSATAMAKVGSILMMVDQTILGIFVIEIVLRLYVHRWRFFQDPWSLFDFTIVAIALMPTSESFSVLRVFRVLRILRLVSMVPSLRRVVSGLIGALPGMGSIVLLMAILFYVFAVMATKLFGEQFPDWFGTLGASAYTLFQITTLESWSMGIVRPVMEIYPWAWAFFVPFILSTAFTVLNLFIGIIVNAIQVEHERDMEASQSQHHDDQSAVLAELKMLRAEVTALRNALPAPQTKSALKEQRA